MSTSNEKKAPQNRTYTVDDIAAILGIGRSTYSLRRGEEVWFIPVSTKPALVLRQNDAACLVKSNPP